MGNRNGKRDGEREHEINEEEGDEVEENSASSGDNDNRVRRRPTKYFPSTAENLRDRPMGYPDIDEQLCSRWLLHRETFHLEEFIACGIIVDYITAEVLELAGNHASDAGATHISILDVWMGIARDDELRVLFNFLPISFDTQPPIGSGIDVEARSLESVAGPLSMESIGEGVQEPDPCFFDRWPTLEEIMKMEFAKPLQAMKKIDDKSWYHDGEKVENLARSFARGHAVESAMAQLLHRLHVRPLQFYGRSQHAVLSGSPRTLEYEHQDADPACAFFYVAFSIEDAAGRDWPFLMEVAPRRKWKGCIVEMGRAGRKIGEFCWKPTKNRPHCQLHGRNAQTSPDTASSVSSSFMPLINTASPASVSGADLPCGCSPTSFLYIHLEHCDSLVATVTAPSPSPSSSPPTPPLNSQRQAEYPTSLILDNESNNTSDSYQHHYHYQPHFPRLDPLEKDIFEAAETLRERLKRWKEKQHRNNPVAAEGQLQSEVVTRNRLQTYSILMGLTEDVDKLQEQERKRHPTTAQRLLH